MHTKKIWLAIILLSLAHLKDRHVFWTHDIIHIKAILGETQADTAQWHAINHLMESQIDIREACIASLEDKRAQQQRPGER